MSQQDITPAVILDPGECISVCGDLRGPLLTRLRNACAPVPIADLLASHHSDKHPAIRETLRDLEYFGSVRIDGKTATALHGNGRPYTRIERRETANQSSGIKTPGVDKGPGTFTTPELSEGSYRLAARRNEVRSGRLPEIIEAIRNGSTIKDAFRAGGMQSHQYLRKLKPDEWAKVKAAHDEATRNHMADVRAETERIRQAILQHLRTSGGDTLEGIQARAIGWGSAKKRTHTLLKAMRAAGDAEYGHVRRGVIHWTARLRN